MSDEENRHRCEVRWCIAERTKRGVNWLREYLANESLASRKGRLEQDILDQWNKGNRGEQGVWL